jgi:hypothetical protein
MSAYQQQSKTFKEQVAADPMFLRYVPANHMTLSICMVAFNQNPYSIRFIPADWRTRTMYVTAIKKDPAFVRILKERCFTDLSNFEIVKLCTLACSLAKNRYGASRSLSLPFHATPSIRELRGPEYESDDDDF